MGRAGGDALLTRALAQIKGADKQLKPFGSQAQVTNIPPALEDVVTAAFFAWRSDSLITFALHEDELGHCVSRYTFGKNVSFPFK